MNLIKTFLLFYIPLLVLNINIYSQQYNKSVNGSTLYKNNLKEPPTQYRREVKLLKGYQTYEQKYAGKNLAEEKKKLSPLGWGTNRSLDRIESASTQHLIIWVSILSTRIQAGLAETWEPL